MKTPVLALIATLAAASISFAVTKPIVIGDVAFKDELVILNQKVVCNAYSAPAGHARPDNIQYGTVTAAMAQEDGSILVDGNLDGEFFQITGNPSESMNFTLQQSSSNGATPEKGPAYSFSSDGAFSNREIHGKVIRSVGLSVLLNGRLKHIGCSLK